MSKVLVIGSVNKDLYIELDREVKIGETYKTEKFTENFGGKGLNQAIACAQSGAQTSFMCIVNTADERQLKSLLNEYNIEHLKMEVESCLPTGIAIVTQINGDNSIVVVPGCNKLLSNQFIEKNSQYITKFDYILVQNEVDSSVLKKLIDLKSENNFKLIYNPAPYENINNIDYCKIDYITPNETEYEHMLMQTPNINKEKLIITLGKKGVVYNEKIYKPYNVNEIDSTGAGDCFNGYFVGLLSLGYSLSEAIDIAQFAAAKSVLKNGSYAGTKQLSDLLMEKNGL